MALKRLAGFRFVEIQHGDTLQRIALREMGDASLWPNLIDINDLTPPYLTDDPALAGPKVKLFGHLLMVPAGEPQGEADPDAARIYGSDVALNKGLLQADETGDLALVAGVPNLKQALENRLATPLRDLLFHASYGCNVHSLKGEAGQPGIATLGAQFVRSAMLDDPRVREVGSAKANLTGDVLSVSATVTPITGTTVDILRAI